MSKSSELAIREFVAKYVNNDNEPTLLPDLTALIKEYFVPKEEAYPKAFVEWIFKEGIGVNEDGTLFHYISIQTEGHPFKKTKELIFNTADELYQYWKENEQ